MRCDSDLNIRDIVLNSSYGNRAQMVRFAVVGVAATGLYLAIASLLERYAGMRPSLAASVAFLPVVTSNYVLHYSWTFRTDRPHASAIPRFIGTSLGGLAINYAVVQWGTRWLNVPKAWILLLAVVFVVVWNYLLSRLWVFVSRT